MVCALALLLATAHVHADAPAADEARDVPDDAIAAMVQQARAIRPLIKTDAVRELLDEVRDLPTIEPRTVWYRRNPQTALSQDAYEALPESERESFQPVAFETTRYYHTFYGTPLASMRAFDLLAAQARIDSFENTRIMDIGFGSIGQLRLLAQAGAHAVGVDVQPIFDVLYRQSGDCGPVARDEGAAGSVAVIIGPWPRDTGKQAGGGYDVIISKNTLKKGYVTPEVVVEGRGIDLGVPVEDYMQALCDALKPGGYVMIYNIGPGPSPTGRAADAHANNDGDAESEYLHMADIRCPFTEAQWNAAGFEVIAFDVNDTDMVRDFARAFGWNDDAVMGDSAMNLEDDLFAMYTLVCKRTASVE
jgi:SAM-dependent methyltransferase